MPDIFLLFGFHGDCSLQPGPSTTANGNRGSIYATEWWASYDRSNRQKPESLIADGVRLTVQLKFPVGSATGRLIVPENQQVGGVKAAPEGCSRWFTSFPVSFLSSGQNLNKVFPQLLDWFVYNGFPYHRGRWSQTPPPPRGTNSSLDSRSACDLGLFGANTLTGFFQRRWRTCGQWNISAAPLATHESGISVLLLTQKHAVSCPIVCQRSNKVHNLIIYQRLPQEGDVFFLNF